MTFQEVKAYMGASVESIIEPHEWMTLGYEEAVERIERYVKRQKKMNKKQLLEYLTKAKKRL